jgi:hypothetical protein
MIRTLAPPRPRIAACTHLPADMAAFHAPVHTVTALKRWSCRSEDKDLPPVDRIRHIHIYDFDNTCKPLFCLICSSL